MKRVAIYTAIFGDYDELKAPVAQDIDCDFFCFTDQVKPRKLSPWRTISVRRKESLSPRMQAKWFKVANHQVFPSGRLKMGFAVRAGQLLGGSRYEATIWVDGSLRIKGAMMAREIAGLVTDGSMAVFEHPDRDCIYEEVAASLPIKKYSDQPLRQQLEHYRSEGTPSHCGLYASGVIGRKTPATPTQIAFEEAWWQENLRWTHQCQVSFGHLVYQTKPSLSAIPAHLRVNPYFDITRHQSDR